MCGSKRWLLRTLAGLALSAAGMGTLRAADNYPTLQRPSHAPAGQLSINPPDGGVRHASFHEPPPVSTRSARLGDREPPQPISQPRLEIGKTKSASSPWRAFATVVASLIAVLGLFCGVLWLVRKKLPVAAGRLPAEVVEVLGHAPLAGRRQMQLVRFGDKLLLLCLSQNGVDTLAEIDRPDEVARLQSLCAVQNSASGEAVFQQVFGKRMRASAEQTSKGGLATSSGLAAMAFQKRRPGNGEDAA